MHTVTSQSELDILLSRDIIELDRIGIDLYEDHQILLDVILNLIVEANSLNQVGTLYL